MHTHSQHTQHTHSLNTQPHPGGHSLRWSRLRGHEWEGATLPTYHSGSFHAMDVPVNQSIFTALPSRRDVRPSMVLVFELVLLRGDVRSVDEVVAWTAFPIADAGMCEVHACKTHLHEFLF